MSALIGELKRNEEIKATDCTHTGGQKRWELTADKGDTGAILGFEMIMVWVWPSSLEKVGTGVIWFYAYRQKKILFLH